MHFAYTCIPEGKARRRRRNWSWERIKRHRQLVRDYRDAWVKHQTEKSLPGSVAELVKKAEDTLNVFNANIARQQTEMEIDRKGLTRVEDQPQGIMGWAKT
ncbi:unnamed protein product, partial [Mesorhabditis belari]|uniref:Uncharacterized protein n=1 Tax=Mesorhabditis belari TaxID=2138241 RepID=A0AAF3EEM9_9BILA